ncbi:hypothetical protein T12_7739 [Trichinella patagoniensis]|uniref:Uncharacterized protein n=1 Tax=Trichinella patagoniensis TaxID=990121 RepID=A0A0V0Z9L8_9BILA|nr:hypothetical protein T12_7739 [Trichinella patagoniensis]
MNCFLSKRSAFKPNHSFSKFLIYPCNEAVKRKIRRWALNVATVAAWRLHCFIEKSLLSQLEFRLHIALSLLQSDGSAPLGAVAVFCCTYPSFSSMYSLYRTKGTL